MQLLDNLKETKRYWKLKEEGQDRALWRTQFGRGYGPVAKQRLLLELDSSARRLGGPLWKKEKSPIPVGSRNPVPCIIEKVRYV
jgi:hypothetical protein